MQEMVTSAGLHGFIQTLDPTGLDQLVRVMARINASGSEESIEGLEERFEQVRQELNRVDDYRNRLTDDRKDIQGLLARIDVALAHGHSGADLVLMRLLLQQRECELEREIALSRPQELLAEKAHLRQEIARRKLMAKLACVVSDAAKEQDG